MNFMDENICAITQCMYWYWYFSISILLDLNSDHASQESQNKDFFEQKLEQHANIFRPIAVFTFLIECSAFIFCHRDSR